MKARSTAALSLVAVSLLAAACGDSSGSASPASASAERAAEEPVAETPAAPEPTGETARASAEKPAQKAAGVTYQEWNGAPDPQVIGGPGEVEPDLFHPAHQAGSDGSRTSLPEPRHGGRVIVHLSTMPRHLNYMTENSAAVRWTLREIHGFLIVRDWETWTHRPELAREYWIEDAVTLADGTRVFGQVSEDSGGIVVTPVSPQNPLESARSLTSEEVADVKKGTVVTLDLHDDIKWHDGHVFDAHDAYFSWQCYWNPTVDCEDSRDKVQKISEAEVLGDHRIRFTFGEQYFLALDALFDLMIVPSHHFNLSDPDNAAFEEGVDPLGRKQGKFVNDHPNNVNWIGLGPYRLTEVNEQYIEAERVEDYYDPERGGWVDTIRWRHIPNDDAAKAAVLEGELDYFARLRSEDYFGEFCQSPQFTESFYKGYSYQPRMQYIAWNMRRPQFADKEVRWALAHSFDWDSYLRTIANGLGVRVTGTPFYLSPFYDHSIQPVPFDMGKAEELLDDAGWYDRDGDGIRDKDGVALEFEYLMTPGNKASETMVLKLQENCSKLGIKVNVTTRDWAAFIERVKQKEFDAFGMAWVLDVENDPYQLWHSVDESVQLRGSNYPGFDDAEGDRLIEAIQEELDFEERKKLFHQLQARIYDQQPYMFTYMVPIKFVMSKRVRNFKNYGMNPGYSIRDWYIVEDEG